MEMNPRQAFHLIELRSQPAGHPAYRTVAHQMHQAIREVAGHRLVADAMKYVDYSDIDLERLEVLFVTQYKWEELFDIVDVRLDESVVRVQSR